MDTTRLYRPGAQHPGGRLTSAPDYLTAAEMVDAAPFGGWTWAAQIGPGGQIEYQER